jgi:hypothetical protein
VRRSWLAVVLLLQLAALEVGGADWLVAMVVACAAVRGLDVCGAGAVPVGSWVSAV